uniref:prephenate dehydratase n=1 Tax=Pseudictyota dubia TaxID=2749911 RepID=A0A7R9Z0Y0_9STRA
MAAVASERAAELYGMDVLDSDIQDDRSNLTRFLALARDPLPPIPGLAYKTSIVFAFKDGPGRLFKSLACFALRDINLTKIESRPLKEEPLADGLDPGPVQFQYLFYIDCEASMADEAMRNALRNLEEHTLFLRVLGSYPRHILTDV